MLVAKVFAALGLLTCLVLALHMCLGRRQQLRLEAAWTRAWNWLFTRGLQRFNARERRRAAHEAALDAIERAKRSSDGGAKDGQWDGNVYRPKQFEKPRKPH